MNTGYQLHNEMLLLHRAEALHHIPAAPVIRQLQQWYDQPLPDKLPAPFAWTTYRWPPSGSVVFTAYWRDVDRSRWRGEYL